MNLTERNHGRGEAGIKSAVGAGGDFKVEQSLKSLEQGTGELM